MADAPNPTSVSTPAEPPTSSDVLASLTGDQLSQWKATGALPSTEKPKEAPKEATPEAPTEPDTEPPAEPEPAVAKPQETPPERKPSAAERRKSQLATEIQDLLRQRAQLRGEVGQLTKPAAPTEPKVEPEKAAAPATVTPTRPRPTPIDLKPDGTPRYPTYEDYVEAAADWKAEQLVEAAIRTERARAEKALRDAEVERQNKAIEEGWKKQVSAAVKRHPDFVEVALAPDFLESIPKGSVMDAFMLRYPEGPDVLYHLATHPDDFERITALDPLDQAGALHDLKRAVAQTAAPAQAQTPPASSETKAPPPPTELAAKGTAPSDEVQAAIQTGDFASYRAKMNARELAARRG